MKVAPRLQALLLKAKTYPPIRTAVIHPCEEYALQGMLEAYREKLIEPVIVAPRKKLERLAQTHDMDLSEFEWIDVPHSHAAADKGVELARERMVDALMKGSLHTEELMSAVMRSDSGMRTGRRMSHIFVLDIPAYPKLLLLSDGGVNIQPDLEQKADIVRNAVGLAQVIGVEQPKIAVLSAVELVTPKIQATIDAAALCKMVDRGQISGCIIDGPLAYDNAISAQAAKRKGIRSSVSGEADILIAPEIESGNLLAKQLEYLAGATAAGLVAGATVPIILTSRSDSPESRVYSCALAILISQYKPVEPNPCGLPNI
jgi:phosphotransacetylase